MPKKRKQSDILLKWLKKFGTKGVKKILSSYGVNSPTDFMNFVGLGDSGWSGTTGVLMGQGPGASLASEAALASDVAAGISTSLAGPGGGAMGQGLANLGIAAGSGSAASSSAAAAAAATEFAPMAAGAGTSVSAASAAPSAFAVAPTAVIPGIGLILAAMSIAAPLLAKATDSSHTPQTAKESIDAVYDLLERREALGISPGEGKLLARDQYGREITSGEWSVNDAMRVSPRAALQYSDYTPDKVYNFMTALGWDVEGVMNKQPSHPGAPAFGTYG